MAISLDRADFWILKVLQSNARLPIVELAEQVGLSASACSRRMRQLEQDGIIQHYVTLLEPAAVGLPVSVFTHVTLEKQVDDALQVFEEAIGRSPEVMECYLMTGDADYLLRVVVPDIAAYRRFLLDNLTRISVVASIKSSFALKQVSYKTALPLAHLALPGA